ncbi:hypothetical protein [Legionella shakespearei]|uniref:Uncharacterized protein n=1 Tax=Legionella shakespearei DSM 23087 TaxID=1122169 RepID=A0A0W0YL26_9GAMM|nr:hypothetical protein [Legionella shakespearei]KTD57584.1 hypothetical protein Lsha_2425 [Legionella shakespearei DSM 23087]
MKTIKTLKHLFRIQYVLIRNGIFILRMLFKVLLRKFGKKQTAKEDTLRKAAEELKPIIVKVGQTLSSQPQLIHETLQHVMDKLHHVITEPGKEKPTRIIDHPIDITQSAEQHKPKSTDELL